MPKKESKGESGKRAAWCALCAVGIYLALQVLGALLVSREVVGEPAVGRRFKGNIWMQGIINF